MKEKFNNPELEIINLDNEDIVTASGEQKINNNETGNSSSYEAPAIH